MSHEIKNLTNEVMSKIHHDNIKMRPRIFFIVGSLATFIGLVLSILTSIFLVSFIRLSTHVRGPVGEYKLDKLLSHFSWWGPICAILGLGVGIWLLRRYDFSYKVNFKIIITGFILAIVTAGLVLDMTGLSEIMLKRGPLRGYFEAYPVQQGNVMHSFQKKNFLHE